MLKGKVEAEQHRGRDNKDRETRRGDEGEQMRFQKDGTIRKVTYCCGGKGQDRKVATSNERE